MIVGLIFFSPHFLAHKKKTISLQHFQLSSPETYKERLGKEIMCERASVSELIADPFRTYSSGFCRALLPCIFDNLCCTKETGKVY